MKSYTHIIIYQLHYVVNKNIETKTLDEKKYVPT